MYDFRFSVEEDTENVNIKIETWLTPKTDEKKDFDRVNQKLSKGVRRILFDSKGLINYNEYFVDLDVRPSGIRYGKRSYMSCNIMLFYKNDIPKIETLLDFLQDFFKSSEVFNFHKGKTDVT